tara:strand:+ start:438 stop:2438 length:2001 start_codon:yes stop_codon:yes gene_type:complete
MAEPIQDGDNGFQGVNTRLDPGLLPDGFCSEAINKRFVNGVAKTRPGIAVMNWSNKAEAYYKNQAYANGDIVSFSGLELDNTFISIMDGAELYNGVSPTATPSGPISNSAVGPFFKRNATDNSSIHIPLASESTVNSTYWSDIGARTFPFTNVKGVGVFRDPSGFEWLLIAAGDGVYATREGNQSFKLPGVSSISDSVTDVVFVQAFNVVLMFQGEDTAPLAMENFANGFVSINQVASDFTIDENDSDGTESIPNSSTALFSGNRVWIPHNRDMVAVSDYLNYTRYAPIMSTLRINQGSEDKLVQLVKFDEQTIIAFKESSIYAIRNTYGNLADMSLDEMTRSYGCVAAKSICTVGRDIWFLDRSGVRSLGVTESGKVQGVDKPVSDPIQSIISRINWPSAGKAVAAYHNNRYFLAVPVDGSTENNIILVYDFQTNTWAGYDEGPAIGSVVSDDNGTTSQGVKGFVKLSYAGAKRLFFVSTQGSINLYDDYEFGGLYDQVVDSDGLVTQSNISDKLVTRGYSGGFTWPKNWREVVCETATNNPQFSVDTKFDGVSETTNLATNKTFSRKIYDRPFGKADFDESNTGNDYLEKFRQDYSWDCGVGITTANMVSGIDPDKKQTHTNKYRLFGNGRFVQVTISNNRGRMEVANVGVLGVKGQSIGRRQT